MDQRAAPLLPAVALAALVLAGTAGVAALSSLLAGSPDGFYRALTLHLGLAIHGWLPAAEILYWRRIGRDAFGGPSAGADRWAALACGAGLLMMVAGGLLDDGSGALPLDYGPLFDNGPFLAGMAVMYATWLFHAVGLLLRGVRTPNQPLTPIRAGLVTSSLAAVAAAACLLAAAVTMPDGTPGSYGIQALVFGPGHALQFVRITLMVTAWGMLLGFPVRGEGRLTATFTALAAVIAGLALWTPLWYLFVDPVAQTMFPGWTLLLGLGLGTMAILTGVMVHAGVRFDAIARVTLLAFGSFLVGGWAPGLADRTALSLTAHYHGLLGAVSATYLALLFDGSPRKGWASHFAAGTLVMAFGFALLKDSPLPRKTAATEATVSTTGQGILFAGAATAGVSAAALWWGMVRRREPEGDAEE